MRRSLPRFGVRRTTRGNTTAATAHHNTTTATADHSRAVKLLHISQFTHAQVAMLETVAWQWYVLDPASAHAAPQRPSLDTARSLKRR